MASASCHYCNRPAEEECSTCGRLYCLEHGEDVCLRCLAPEAATPSGNVYRGSLLALVAASLVAMSLVSTDLSIPLVLAAIAVSGLGMGAVQPALSTTVANAVDDVDLGVAGATIQMVAQIATSLGMNLLDSLEAGMADRVGAAHAYSNAYLIGAAITAVGVAAAWMLPRRPARAATR